MKTKGKRQWQGNVRVIAYKRDGSIKDIVEIQNTTPNVSLNAARDMLKGEIHDLEIKYMAWGSDDTEPSAEDTALGSEFGRKQITEKDAGDEPGELITTTYMSPNEGTEETIEELGWFGGASATGNPNTGIIIARVLYSRAKTNLESLQVERTDIFSEVL